MSPEQIERLLHEAADRVGREYGTPGMDALAEAGALFLHNSDIFDETGVAVDFSVAQAIGYGVMLGWLARDEL